MASVDLEPMTPAEVSWGQPGRSGDGGIYPYNGMRISLAAVVAGMNGSMFLLSANLYCSVSTTVTENGESVLSSSSIVHI